MASAVWQRGSSDGGGQDNPVRAAPPGENHPRSSHGGEGPRGGYPPGLPSDDLKLLVGYLEREVRVRLDALDRKMDKLLGAQHKGTRALPSGQHPPVVPLASTVRPKQAKGDKGPRIDGERLGGKAVPEEPSVDLSIEEAQDVSPGAQEQDVSRDSHDLQREVSRGSDVLKRQLSPKPGEDGGDRGTSISWSSRRTSRSSLRSANSEDMELAKTEYLKRKQRSMVLDNVWKIMEDRESSKHAQNYERTMCAIIIVSVVTALLQTQNFPVWDGPSASAFEGTVDAIFAIEILVRFIACPHRCKFWRSMYNIIDVVSALPLVLRMYLGFVIPVGREDCEVACLMLRGLVPVVRLMKLLRRFQQFHLLLKAFLLALEAMPVLIFIYVSIMMSFAAMIYIVEPHTNVESFMRAWWLAMVSMTTVGYGDMTPQTQAGKMVVGLFVFTTALYMAIPLGIIGNAFNDVWKDRDHILLMQRTRQRLEQAGYTPHDIPTLFKLFDADRNGQLDVQEFNWMLQGMRLGLQRERVMELYTAFDDDKSGGIDPDEFVKALFPDEYCEIFEKKDPENDLPDIDPTSSIGVMNAALEGNIASRRSRTSLASASTRRQSDRQDIDRHEDGDFRLRRLRSSVGMDEEDAAGVGVCEA